jgi:hypothetical protein
MDEEEIDDRGSLRQRLQALDEECVVGRETLEQLRTEAVERRQRVSDLEARIALLPPIGAKRGSTTVKLVMGVFLLPIAALGGAVSGLFAGLPVMLASVTLFRDGGEAWVTAPMFGFMLLGTVSAVTLAVRALRRG